MNVYVESNFVLELALLQEQCPACEDILGLCETRDVALVLPAYSLMEPYGTLMRRHVEALKTRNCKVLPGFDQGLRYLRWSTSEESPS